MGKKINLEQLREAASEHGDTRLLNMTNRELRATALENYLEQSDRETVIRTRIVDAQSRSRRD